MGKRQRKKLDGLVEARKCTATKRDGTPCKRPPIKGGTVCMSHGGAAPQVRRKANERLLKGVPKMLTELNRLATDESMPPNVRLAAIRDWLDRAGIGETAKAELKVSVEKWEENLGDVFLQYDAGDDEPITLSPDDDGAYVPDEKDARWEGMPRRQPTGNPRPADPPPPRRRRPDFGDPNAPGYASP